MTMNLKQEHLRAVTTASQKTERVIRAKTNSQKKYRVVTEGNLYADKCPFDGLEWLLIKIVQPRAPPHYPLRVAAENMNAMGTMRTMTKMNLYPNHRRLVEMNREQRFFW